MGAYGGFGAESSWSVAGGKLGPWEAIFMVGGIVVDAENCNGQRQTVMTLPCMNYPRQIVGGMLCLAVGTDCAGHRRSWERRPVD